MTTTYPPGYKKTANTKFNWGTGEPYPEYLCEDIDPKDFKEEMRFSNEIHECFYCKQNISNYPLFLKHLEKEHQDMTSDPDQSLWVTQFYGYKPDRRKPKRRTTTFNPNRTRKYTRKSTRTKTTTKRTPHWAESDPDCSDCDFSELQPGQTRYMKYKYGDSVDSKGNVINMTTCDF